MSDYKSLKDILVENAGSGFQKGVDMVKHAESKAILKNLRASFNKGRARARRPMQEVSNFEDTDKENTP